MEITWLDGEGKPQTGRVPDNVQCFVDAIGLDATAQLILELGGAPFYFPMEGGATPNGRLVRAIGAEAAAKLSNGYGGGFVDRIPLAPQFLARQLRSRGLGVQELARRLRRSDVMIRKYLKSDGARKDDFAKSAKSFSRAANRRAAGK